MRVLYLCHRIPYPPDKGDKIRAYREVCAIAERHEVDLFTLADRVEDLDGESSLRHFCRNVHVSALSRPRAAFRTVPALLSRKPLSLAYFYSADLDIAVHKAVLRRSYDRIFVYCSSMAHYVRDIRDIPAVIDFVDVDSDKWTQYAKFTGFPFSVVYRREGQFLRIYERKLCKRYPVVVVATEREAHLLRRIWERAEVHVVSNGVDAAYFDPAAIRATGTQPVIVFTGDMAYFPNQEAVKFFALRVLPLVRKAVPDARFVIVGRNPNWSVRRLANIDGVTVTGTVRDIRPYLATAQVAVAPFSIAAGIQNKILEAMAFALPVVATPRAVQGLAPSVAEMVETGESPQEFSELVVSFLRDASLAQKNGMEGRQRVTAEYNWDGSLARLLELVETAHRQKGIDRTLSAVQGGQ